MKSSGDREMWEHRTVLWWLLLLNSEIDRQIGKKSFNAAKSGRKRASAATTFIADTMQNKFLNQVGLTGKLFIEDSRILEDPRRSSKISNLF